MNVEVYADAVRIDQIIINFITNAIKYAPESKKIIIHIEKTNGMAKVSVTDKGLGIPAEKQRFLFDRYYRVDNRLIADHISGAGGILTCLLTIGFQSIV